MSVMPLKFQMMKIELRMKLAEKLDQKYPQVYSKIRTLLEGIWQRLEAHTAFILSAAIFPPGSRDKVAGSADSILSSRLGNEHFIG